MVACALLAATAGICFATYSAISFQLGTKFWDEGVAAASRGDFDTAISKYDAALRTRLGASCAGIVYANRGIAYNSKGLVDSAVLDFADALRLHPGLVEGYVGRSFAYISKGEIDKAFEDANEALRIDANSRDAYHNRAVAFLNKREFGKAIADFGEAIRCDPDNADLYVERGNAFLTGGQYDGAIASFESAIQISPWVPAAYWGRDFAWEKRAYDLLSKGVKAASERKYDEAITFYSEGLASHPGVRNHAVLLCNRATTLGYLKRREESARDYDEAIRLDPSFVEAHFNRAINHRECGRIPEATRDFSEALRLNPKFAPAYVNRAAIYARQNKLDEARADWLNALENIASIEAGQRPRLLNNIAWQLATSPASVVRDGKAAVPAATQACELTNWRRSDCVDTLAAAYATAGDFRNAIDRENRALQLADPSSEEYAGMKKRLDLYQHQKPYREIR